MTIYLIRHANAGRRQPGGQDRDRPLDQHGTEQATRIRDALGDAGIERIMSSPARRCIETVQPVATALGLGIEVDDALWEGHGATAAMALLARLVEAGQPAALCSHGDVIPMMLDTLAARGVPLQGVGCAKGSIWRLDLSAGDVVGGSYTAVP